MLLHGHDEIAVEKLEKCHNGVGAYEVRTLFETEFGSGMKYIRELVLNPGATIGIHPHAGDEEIYYVVSGQGEMIVDDEKRSVKPGDAVLTKSGSRHGLNNPTDNDLKIFVVCASVDD
ncbi:MAG: cupin domain-containing protein [Deltaproteobacteria bacterium]|nr:cupin domain-containing protein [Deltaproteobacteria bacterium]